MTTVVLLGNGEVGVSGFSCGGDRYILDLTQLPSPLEIGAILPDETIVKFPTMVEIRFDGVPALETFHRVVTALVDFAKAQGAPP